MQNAVPINIADKAECVKALTEQLENMPIDVLGYISGAVDLARVLDAATKEKEQAS